MTLTFIFEIEYLNNFFPKKHVHSLKQQAQALDRIVFDSN